MDHLTNSALHLDRVDVVRADMLLCQAVTAEVLAGQIWHIVGANGLGKSTLLMMLAGLLPSNPQQLHWGKLAARDWQTLFLGHRLGLNETLTARENLQFLANIQRISHASVTTTRIENALNVVGLAGYEDVMVAKLSSGQQRRVALSRLWLCDLPILWLLDEPLTALDVAMSAQLNLRLTQHAAIGGRVLLTSHQPVSAAQYVLDLAQYRVCHDDVRDDVQVIYDEIY